MVSRYRIFLVAPFLLLGLTFAPEKGKTEETRIEGDVKSVKMLSIDYFHNYPGCLGCPPNMFSWGGPYSWNLTEVFFRIEEEVESRGGEKRWEALFDAICPVNRRLTSRMYDTQCKFESRQDEVSVMGSLGNVEGVEAHVSSLSETSRFRIRACTKNQEGDSCGPWKHTDLFISQ